VNPLFETDLGGATSATVYGTSLAVREQVNELYRLTAHIAARDVEEDFAERLLDQPVTLKLPEGDRTFHGVIASVEYLSTDPQGLRAYRFTVVPALNLLKRRRNYRIFQDKTALEIVTTILDERSVSHDLRCVGNYASREYCVQYGETDYAFVKRLLAEEGVFYFFEHGAADTELFVLADTAEGYSDLDGASDVLVVEHHDVVMNPRRDQVTRFVARHAGATRAVISRGFDYRRPILELSDADIALEAPAIPSSTSAPGTARALTKEQRDGLTSDGIVAQTHYTHDGSYEARPQAPSSAMVSLDRERANVLRASADSWCPNLAPGRRITITEHLEEALNRRWVVALVEHHFAQREGHAAYTNRFECVPAEVRIRPRRPKRKARQTLETAIVVAAPGEEIHTDALGRVKVQFHWDREGARDDHSSCFLRVAQAWTGAAFGAQFIPRAGTEVLVSFISGDTDRPVVVGCLYNGAQLPPFPLPENATQSGFRTRSTPGGEGSNELLFDDQRGGELVSVRSQRTLVLQSLEDSRLQAGGNWESTIARNRKAQVDGNDELTIKGSQTVTIQGGVFSNVTGPGGAAFGGNRVSTVAGDDTLRIEGQQTTMIKGNAQLIVGVGDDGGDALFSANGNLRLGAKDELRLTANKRIQISCGESTLEILPDGIKIKAPKVTLEAAEGLSCSSPVGSMSIDDHLEFRADEIKLFSKNGSLIMDDDAKLDAKLVKLNCDPERPKPNPPKEGDDNKGKIVFKVDPHFEPKPGDSFTLLIATPTGDVVEKETDANFEVHIEGEIGDRYTLVDVRKDGKSVGRRGG
jgi:type VI secretion system secreted protein VgrG